MFRCIKYTLRKRAGEENTSAIGKSEPYWECSLKREIYKTNPRCCLQCLVNYPNLYFGCLGYIYFVRGYNLVLFSCTTTIFITDINWKSKTQKPFCLSFITSNFLRNQTIYWEEETLLGWMPVVVSHFKVYKQWKEINGITLFLDIVETSLSCHRKSWILVLFCHNFWGPCCSFMNLGLVIFKFSALKLCNSYEISIRSVWHPSVPKSLLTFNFDMNHQNFYSYPHAFKPG